MKTKIKRIWWDLTHPKEWYIFLSISRTLWKIKDYDRIESDYSSVLCHATLSRMSKTNYQLQSVYSVIDEAQQDIHYGIIKEDLSGIIEGGGTLEDVKEYLRGL